MKNNMGKLYMDVLKNVSMIFLMFAMFTVFTIVPIRSRHFQNIVFILWVFLWVFFVFVFYMLNS